MIFGLVELALDPFVGCSPVTLSGEAAIASTAIKRVITVRPLFIPSLILFLFAKVQPLQLSQEQDPNCSASFDETLARLSCLQAHVHGRDVITYFQRGHVMIRTNFTINQLAVFPLQIDFYAAARAGVR